jgi:hypothetical protein
MSYDLFTRINDETSFRIRWRTCTPELGTTSSTGSQRRGVLKVSLLSIPRMLAVTLGGPFPIVPFLLIVFTFYPSGVPAGPLLDPYPFGGNHYRSASCLFVPDARAIRLSHYSSRAPLLSSRGADGVRRTLVEKLKQAAAGLNSRRRLTALASTRLI